MSSIPKEAEHHEEELHGRRDTGFNVIEREKNVQVKRVSFHVFSFLICFCCLYCLHKIGGEAICLEKGRIWRASHLKMVSQK